MDDDDVTDAPGWRVMVAVTRDETIIIEIWAAAVSDSDEAIRRVLAASGSDAATIRQLDQHELDNLRLQPGEVRMVLDDAWAAILRPAGKRH
ncbi:hypothetical protein AB8Z38_22940 [Bradyrhizobium sp. LLZ17]|uniref:Uncharacterized protein n=1 Tax=Bradyrhizobium sp. LLZ17 TaxID=3239388 RepID=A0AB39XFM9_9BRAD